MSAVPTLGLGEGEWVQCLHEHEEPRSDPQHFLAPVLGDGRQEDSWGSQASQAEKYKMERNRICGPLASTQVLEAYAHLHTKVVPKLTSLPF